MGMPIGMSSCNCEESMFSPIVVTVDQRINQNPNPYIFEINSIVKIGNHCILKIKYPNCTNYEGMKILVYKDTKPKQVYEMNKIDPHFCENCKPSPFARFEPTEEGMNAAMELCEYL